MLSRAAFSLILVNALVASTAAAQQRCVEATRLEYDRSGARASGEVRLRLPGCTIRALELRLGPGEELRGEHVDLRSEPTGPGAASGLRLTAHRLYLGPEGELQARWVRGQLCGCSDTAQASLGAARAWVNRGGRRLHLTRPSLWIGRRRVLTLPYMALPLSAGVSGLLMPRVGYSGRDGLRLEQGAYLAPGERLDLLLHGGWIQRRGPTARGRLRLWHHERGALELTATGLVDDGRWRGAVRGRAVAWGRRWAAGVTPDLASDLELPADLAHHAARVFAPYLRSRLWAWTGAGPLVVLARADLLQDVTTPVARAASSHGRLATELALLPTRLAGPLWVDLLARVRHWEPAPATAAGRFTALSLYPGVSVTSMVGPFGLHARGGYQLRGVLAPGNPGQGGEQLQQAGMLTAHAALPMARNYGDVAARSRYRHVVQPVLGLQWARASAGAWATPDNEHLRQGAHGMLGLRTWLLGRRAGSAARHLASAGARLLWPMFDLPRGTTSSDVLLAGELQLRPLAGVQAGAALLWEAGQNTLVRLQTELCAQLDAGQLSLRPCAGYTRLRSQQTSWWSAAGHSGWGPHPAQGAQLALELDHLRGALDLRWGVMQARGRVSLDPLLGQVTHWWGSLDLDLGCGCYRVGLWGRGRLDQQWPDVGLRLQVNAARSLAGCAR